MKVFKDEAFTHICGARVSYGFYGRIGGVSQNEFASLNCGPGSGDDLTAVAQNRNLVAKHLCGNDQNISTLYQCHSGDCMIIDKHVKDGDARPRGDALVTDVPNLPIGVLTADCGPVLFVGRKESGAPVIAAAHAGWGGALHGVLEDTVAKMVSVHAQINSIHAVVGPCIQVSSYEVKNDFAPPFLKRHEAAEHFFKPAQKDGHLMFDLSGYIAFRLSLAGVKHISLMGVDTYKEEEFCYSYRRATHRGEGQYGRQMSAIVIKT